MGGGDNLGQNFLYDTRFKHVYKHMNIKQTTVSLLCFFSLVCAFKFGVGCKIPYPPLDPPMLEDLASLSEFIPVHIHGFSELLTIVVLSLSKRLKI